MHAQCYTKPHFGLCALLGYNIVQCLVSFHSYAEWVSGSPRSSNYFGQVFVYDYSEETTTFSGGQVFQDFSSASIILTGTQVSESCPLGFNFLHLLCCMCACVWCVCVHVRVCGGLWCLRMYVIFCSQIGAYFGYSIAGVDFNGDQ